MLHQGSKQLDIYVTVNFTDQICVASLKHLQDFNASLLFVLKPEEASPNAFHSALEKSPKEVTIHNTSHSLYNSDISYF